MWPISPAAPRPSQRCFSTMIAPPTPVPHQSPRNVRNGRPAPRTASPSTAVPTSFPTRTGTPKRLASVSPSGNRFVQRLGGRVGDGRGAAVPRRGPTRLTGDGIALVDDDGLDLGAAEVDATSHGGFLAPASPTIQPLPGSRPK